MSQIDSILLYDSHWLYKTTHANLKVMYYYWIFTYISKMSLELYAIQFLTFTGI